MFSVIGTPYEVANTQIKELEDIANRVSEMRKTGALTSEFLTKLRKYFRIKNIYHSNAIEGNILDIGETRMVVEQGLRSQGNHSKIRQKQKICLQLSIFLKSLQEIQAGP